MAKNKIAYLTPVHHPLAPVAEEDAPWEQLKECQRVKALERLVVIKPILNMLEEGLKRRPAITHFLLALETGRAHDDVATLAMSMGRKGQSISRATLNRYIKDYEEQGIMGLVDNYKGSQRKSCDWEARALYYLRMGSKNNPGTIAKMLQQEGVDVQDHQVRRWHNALPANVRNNPGRLGALKFDSSQKGYVRRKVDHLPVGSCYQSDGNMMPIYLQHPTGTRPARYEITPLIDVVSRYVPGYYLSDSESAISTLHAITDAIQKENHVPLDIQADNGPGFKNKMVQRFYRQLGITPSHPRARNPKDNGYIERWHAILRDEFLKKFPGYCGKDAAPEPLKAYLRKVDKGEETLMSQSQFTVLLDEFIRWYNFDREHGEIGCAPAALWAELKPNPPVDIKDAFFWDEATRVVRRSSISFMNREYQASELIQFNGDKVIVEYNIYNDDFIKVRDLNGGWLCDAKRISASPYRSTSVMDDRKISSDAQKRKRQENKAVELERRSQRVINADHATNILDDLVDLSPVINCAPLRRADNATSDGPAIDSWDALSGFDEADVPTHPGLETNLFDDPDER